MRIELHELGTDQYVEIHDPMAPLPWKVQRKLGLLHRDKNGEPTDEAKLDMAEILTVALVKVGNVLDRDNKPIPFPLTNDTVGDVPGELVMAVLNAFSVARGGKIVESVDPT